jgi:Ca2+-binding RTX toxin-like protein
LDRCSVFGPGDACGRGRNNLAQSATRCVSGSLGPKPPSHKTTRATWPICCARTPSGHDAAAPPRSGFGRDSFLFNSAFSKLSFTNIDKIEDFSVLDDTIQLENAVFTELGPFSTLSAGAFFIGAAAHDRDDRIVYDSSTGSLMYDADGSDSGQAKAFAVLDIGLALTHDDFSIV